MNALRGLIAGSGLLLVAAPALSQDVTFTKDMGMSH